MADSDVAVVVVAVVVAEVPEPGDISATSDDDGAISEQQRTADSL